MWGDESEAVAPIIWLYQIVDAQKEEVFFPELLITLRSYDNISPANSCRVYILSIDEKLTFITGAHWTK